MQQSTQWNGGLLIADARRPRIQERGGSISSPIHLDEERTIVPQVQFLQTQLRTVEQEVRQADAGCINRFWKHGHDDKLSEFNLQAQADSIDSIEQACG
ncbi:MAG: hypothetical protein ABIT64_05305 [Lysobacteraceae bacterium]